MNRQEADFGLILKDKRREIIRDIVAFFQDERGEDIGVIAAEEVLDFFIDKIGKSIYNKGVEDVHKLIRSRMEDVYIDIESLILKK